MGLSKKKQTQTTHEVASNTATNTPNVPDWYAKPTENMAGGINALIGQGPAAFTPHTNDLQKTAWDAGANMKGYGGTDFSAAEGAIGDVGDVQGESLLTGLSNYYNPFKEQVLNPVLNDYDFSAGETRAGQAADAARNKAFQGSRYGLQEGATEGQLARGRAATEGGLLKDMQTEALGASESDAGRRQQAAIQNQQAALQKASLQQSLAGQRSSEGLAMSADERARAASQAALGQQKYELDKSAQQYPLEYANQMEGLLRGLNPALFTGNTATGNSVTDSTVKGTANQSLGSWFGDFLTASAQSAGKAAAAGA